MSTFAVKVVRIKNIEPIENADAIELAVIGDYRSVVKKGEFSANQLAVYIPEASVVPLSLLQNMGLEGKLAGSAKNRVKAIKLRGCLSQGLLYPIITNYPNGLPYGQAVLLFPSEDGLHERFVNEGDDVAGDLGIIKYEPPIPIHLNGEVYNATERMTVSYDIENFKAYPDVLIPGEEVIFTEKIHGTFCGIGILPSSLVGEQHPKGRFVVFSKGLGARGLCFKDVDQNHNNVYLRSLEAHDIYDKLNTLYENLEAMSISLHEPPRSQPLFLLGEVFGEVGQDLNYGSRLSFRVFDVVFGFRGNQRYLNFDDLMACSTLVGFNTVPVLYRGPFSKEVMLQHTKGFETISGTNAHMREGVVVKPVMERYVSHLGRVILKSVSEDYLLRKGKATEFS